MTSESQDPAQSRLVSRALCAWLLFVQRHARAVLICSVVLAVLSMAYAGMKLGFKTNRTDLLDPNSFAAKSWAKFEKEFGDDMDIVIVLEGEQRETIVQAIETLARDLAACPNQFDKICHRIDTDKLKAKGLFQLSLDDVTLIREKTRLLPPLLIGGWNYLTVENLTKIVKFRAMTLAANKPIDPKAREFLQTGIAMLESLSSYLDRPNEFRSPWMSMISIRPDPRLQEIPEYFFSSDGKLAFLRVNPKKDASSFVGYGKSVGLARLIVNRVQGQFPALRIGMTGLPVLEDDEMQASQSASSWSLLVSIVGVAIMFAVGFRAIRHPIYGMGTLLIAGCLSLGWIALTIGHLNILSVSFIVTLVGMGIDYGICWLSRYESNRALGYDRETSNNLTASTVGTGIMTGALTTACAFFATMFTGFRGLSELGFVGGSGILLCLICTFTVLPALLKIAGANNVRSLKRCRDNDAVLGWLTKRPGYVLAASILLLVPMIACAPFVKSDYNLLNLQSEKLASVQLEKKLVERMGASGWYLVSMANSPDEAIALKQKFEKLPTVGRVIELASILPKDQEKKQPIIAAIHQSFERLPEKVMASTISDCDAATLRQQLLELAKVSKELSAGDGILVDRLTSLAKTCATRLGEFEPNQQHTLVSEFQQKWKSDLLLMLHRLKNSSSPELVTIDDIPDAIRPRYLSAGGKWMVQVFAKGSIWDIPPLVAFTNEVLSVDPDATGKPLTGLTSVIQMADGYKRAAWLSLAVILIFVMIEFRNVGHVLLCLVPLAFGLAVMVGCMTIFGIAFNPANLIAFPMVIGAGVGYGVYVLNDYRQSEGPYVLTWRLARAVGLSGLATVVGFASLLTANHWGLITIGLILSIGVSSCLVAAEIVLPAILMILSRRRGSSATRIEEGDASDDESSPTILSLPTPAQSQPKTRRAAA